MRKIRNPRYAPEFLERKLSPSAVVYAPAQVQVMTMTADDTTADGPTYPPDDPTPIDPVDPTTPPSDPGGPSGPSPFTP